MQQKIHELKETCNFKDVFSICSQPETSLHTREEPVSKIGHIRAYFDGRRWWGDYFSCRDSLKTEAFVKEAQEIYKQIVENFPNLRVLRLFCEKHPAASIGDGEYSFYLNGDAADYWIRFILREKDYNCYLYAYKKAGDEMREQDKNGTRAEPCRQLGKEL